MSKFAGSSGELGGTVLRFARGFNQKIKPVTFQGKRQPVFGIVEDKKILSALRIDGPEPGRKCTVLSKFGKRTIKALQMGTFVQAELPCRAANPFYTLKRMTLERLQCDAVRRD